MKRPSIICFVQYLALALMAAASLSCTSDRPRWRIGVSQCSEDIWREKLNSELRMAAYAHEEVELLFMSADDNNERQVKQIDSLLQADIDLLIVAPNQMSPVTPAIDRAYDRGTPVIVFERKTSSQKFTAYMGGDNRLMGLQMGNYVAQTLKGKGRVVEIMGLKGSSPAIERHEGFSEALSRYPDIELVASLQGDWTEQSGYEAMKERLESERVKSEQSGTPVTMDIDLVFGQNDRMAIGARKALLELENDSSSMGEGGWRLLFCGIDGLPGEDGGIASVRDGVLEASYIYPTHGDEVLALALAILKGETFQHDTPLPGTLVTRDNAQALLLQAGEIARQTSQIDNLHDLTSLYGERLTRQRTFTLLACCTAALLLLVLVLFMLYHRSKVAIRRERVLSNVWNLPQHSTPSSSESRPSAAETSFITRFKEVVEKRLHEPDLSVEELAADMLLSRVQLYRKVKSLTGSSPVELLRTARLNRGHQMLLTTDMTVSEVAYAVGFSAPAYFTKCFKEEFGFVPGEARR